MNNWQQLLNDRCDLAEREIRASFDPSGYDGSRMAQSLAETLLQERLDKAYSQELAKIQGEMAENGACQRCFGTGRIVTQPNGNPACVKYGECEDCHGLGVDPKQQVA